MQNNQLISFITLTNNQKNIILKGDLFRPYLYKQFLFS